MIDVKDGNAKEMWVTYFCPECEALFGTSIEFRCDYSDRTQDARDLRKKKMARFEKCHDCCGEKELDERISRYTKSKVVDIAQGYDTRGVA